jgi:hypothetical protein
MTKTTLVSSAARTTSGTSDTAILHGGIKAMVFLLDVTNADTDAGDTLNVRVQETPDEGTTWNDIVSFAQVIGTGAAGKVLAKVNCEASPETELGAPTEALAAGNVLQGPVCPYVRAKWTIVNAGTVDASFTFSLTMYVIR